MKEASTCTSSLNFQSTSVLLLCNAHLIRYTWPVFKAAASQYKPGIIAITENWLPDNISDTYTYGDYHCFYSSRSARIGGGVLLLFSPSYSVMQKINIPVQPPDPCNVVSVVDVNSGQCWVLVYRPEKMSQDITQLCKYLDYLLAEYQSVTIMGNFNLSKMKWHVPIEQQQLSAIYRKFYQFCASWDLR